MLTTMSEPSLLVLGGMALAFASMAAVRIGMAVYGQIQFERAYRRHPRVVPFNEDRHCKKPHDWKEVMLAVRDLAPGRYTVCLDCGAVSGNHEKMVSEEVLQQAREALANALKKQEAEREIQDRIAAIVDHRVTQYIHQNFSKESNDPTFVMKLIELAETTLRAQDDAIEKVATELEVQKDLDLKTSTWMDGTKGNA